MSKSSWFVLASVGIVLVVAGCATTETDRMVSETGPVDGGPTPAPVENADEPPVNTLKWTTASEVDNFGFDIYRSLNEDGPFERITNEPLAGAGTTDEPQNYVFIDSDIDPTKDYFYYVESISLGGVREIFSPVIRAAAKRPVESKD